MNEVQRERSYSVGAVAMMAMATGCLTWLCVGWFGSQSLLTAAVGVMLVELFLACLGVIVMLLAARLSDTYLKREDRQPEQPARSQRLWLWRPIWQPIMHWDDRAHHRAAVPLTPVDDWLRSVHDEMRPLDDVDEPPATLPFPTAVSTDASPRDRHIGDPPAHRWAA